MKLFDQKEELRREVYQILLEVGAIKTCEYHGTTYYLTGIESGLIYGAATNRYKEKHKTQMVPPDFHSQIKEILDEASFNSTCPLCEKAFSD